MANNPKDIDHTDEELLGHEASDAALEAAARATGDAAMSIVGAPTVSVLFSCCGSD